MGIDNFDGDIFERALRDTERRYFELIEKGLIQADKDCLSTAHNGCNTGMP